MVIRDLWELTWIHFDSSLSSVFIDNSQINANRCQRTEISDRRHNSVPLASTCHGVTRKQIASTSRYICMYKYTYISVETYRTSRHGSPRIDGGNDLHRSRSRHPHPDPQRARCGYNGTSSLSIIDEIAIIFLSDNFISLNRLL